jgi:hypothetical protein
LTQFPKGGAQGGAAAMSFDIRRISIPDFLRTDVMGVFDFEATRSLLTQIVASTFRSGIHRILVDVRAARLANIGVADIYTLVMHLMALGLDRGHKLAILNDPPEEFDGGKLFEQCAVRQGMNVAAFRDFEAALEWLSAESP